MPAKIGLSMLYMLSEPFSIMTKQFPTSLSPYVELVDDGYHCLNKKRVKILTEIAESYGLKYSLHAPFADINIASPSKTMLKASMKQLTRSLHSAYELDAYLWVLHPGNKSGISAFYPGADWKQNSQSIKQLYKTARNYGLAVAMENLPKKYNFLMTTAEEFNRFYMETGLTDIGIVLDTGHANLEAQIEPFLKEASNRITHIHISDNHGVIDEHLGLGHGKIDWKQFFSQIKSNGFQGTVLAESVFNVEETLTKIQQLLS